MQRVVLLLHGIYDSSKDFEAMERFLRSKGFDPHGIDLKPSNGKEPLEQLAVQVADYVENHLQGVKRFDIVAFSMGSLVARYYIQKLGGARRVAHLVMISGPNKGSPWAYFFKRPGFRQMRPGSPFLRELNKDSSAYKKMKVLCLWTPLDLTVPAWRTILPHFPQQKVWVLAHPLMMESKKVFNLVRLFLADEV